MVLSTYVETYKKLKADSEFRFSEEYEVCNSWIDDLLLFFMLYHGVTYLYASAP